VYIFELLQYQLMTGERALIFQAFRDFTYVLHC